MGAAGSISSSRRSRITKTSLALLWLLSSSEIFGCCKRIESTGGGLHRHGIHHQHHAHREVRGPALCLCVHMGGVRRSREEDGNESD